MSIPGSTNPLLLFGDPTGGQYQIQRSLRFNSSDSGFLSRTPAVAGNRRTWTWAAWVKRSALATGTDQVLFSGGMTNSGTGFLAIYFENNGVFSLGSATTNILTTTPVYRDTGAWAHILFAFNSTVGSNADKAKLYVNGVEVTTFSIDNRSGITNQDYGINQAALHEIGRQCFSSARYFDGYLADIHFIDGQALTPSSFTEVSATTGQLIPKAYSGTFGTNGFWLKFSDNSAATAATLGKDYSGNSNNWTPNNFSVVGGVNAITTPASNAPPTVDYLVVAGGGGGGADRGGGGGAGGLRSSVTNTGGGGSLESPLAVNAGFTYTVTVGAGGAGGVGNASKGSSGVDSVFSSITSTGGGGGGAGNGSGTTGYGVDGGSGGGASGAGQPAGNNSAATNLGGSGTANQGRAGGTAQGNAGGNTTIVAGGGGGASVAGVNATNATGSGNGGAGVAVSITGSSVTYGGGGGGGSGDTNNGQQATVGVGGAGGGGNGGSNAGSGSVGNPGTANLGGGGGGGTGDDTNGGAGGSGVVIIRYANTYDDLIVGSGLTYTYANTGGYKIYSFTASVTPAQSAGNDSLVDTPTSIAATDTGVGGEIRGNYATLNPLQVDAYAATLSNGNLDYSTTVSGNYADRFSTIGVSSGKWYAEATVGAIGNGIFFGVAIDPPYSLNYIGATSTSWGYLNNATKYNNGGSSAYGASFTANDVIGIALDLDAGTLVFYKNGSSQGTAYSSLPAGTYFIGISGTGTASSTFNFGQRAFSYTAPSGFKALCDTNLGAPLVAKPSTVFDVITYTGTGSSLTLPNGSSTPTSISFTPDFAWLKGRSGATDHALYDAVRGVQKDLVSNSTSAETTETTGLTAFGTNTFTVGSLAKLNTSSSTYVAWAWYAGTGSPVTDSTGDRTSTYKANQTAGFSIVTWTLGSNTDPTTSRVRHGLNVTPSFVIVRRLASGDWSVKSEVFADPVRTELYLNLTNAAAVAGVDLYFRNSSYIGFRETSFGSGPAVAYCFAPVVGYSSVSSYVGNGSSDGPFVYTGFRPRWILIKNSSATADWSLFDTARDSYNQALTLLAPNLSAADNVLGSGLDILSNGFKLRRDASPAINASSNTFVYAAFAENPFQYARAR